MFLGGSVAAEGGEIDEGGEDPGAFCFFEGHKVDRGAGTSGAEGAADAERVFGGIAQEAAAIPHVVHFDLCYGRVCDTDYPRLLLEYNIDGHLSTVGEISGRAGIRGWAARVTKSCLSW